MNEPLINIFLVALPILTILAWIAAAIIAVSFIVWLAKWAFQKIQK